MKRTEDFSDRYRVSLRYALTGSALVSLLAMLMVFSVAGCGDTSTSTVSGPTAGKISRPTPGTVELIDARNDISGSQDLTAAPSWLDLNWASVSREADTLSFTMDLAGALPASMPSGIAGEWGFMLDVDQDGTSDWVIYASSTFTDGWTAGLYNPKTKERLAGPAFPGTVSHADTKIVLTASSKAIAVDQGFKWFAFANEYTKSAQGQNQQAGDHIPDLAVPDSSADWLPYP